MTFLPFAFVTIISVFLVSCVKVDPQKAKTDAINYNDVIQQVQSEQLLRNIVHRSYGEPASYMRITSVTASYTLSSNLSVSPNLSQTFNGEYRGTTASLGLSPSISYSDSPTIFYTPIDDSGIVTLLEQPITFNQIDLLMRNGTNFLQFVADVGFLSVGDMSNGFDAGKHAEASTQKSYTKYLRFVHIIQRMVERNFVTDSIANYNGEDVLWLQFSPAAATSSDALLIKKMLHVPSTASGFILLPESLGVVAKQSEKIYTVQPSIDAIDDNLVTVQMRSISSIVSFLANAVHIPESDLKANFSVQTRDASGGAYDYSAALKDILIIYSSVAEPKDAFVKTFMHGHWFYIKMSDINSKYTFDMLLKLMTLTLGVGAANTKMAPQITIPAGGR